MSRFTLSVLAFGAIFGLSMSALYARQVRQTQFVYLRLVPGLPARDGQIHRQGYQACEAAISEWKCREFPSSPEADSDDGLRRAFATLGSEGWEIVAVFDETVHLSYPKGQTYLFKRSVAR